MSTVYEYPLAWLADESDIHDGDTMWLHLEKDLDFGFHITQVMSARIKFRVAHVNCPELNTPAGVAARDFTVNWFKQAPLDLMVRVLHADNYGDRWDAEIINPATGELLSDALLKAGHAVPMASTSDTANE